MEDNGSLMEPAGLVSRVCRGFLHDDEKGATFKKFTPAWKILIWLARDSVFGGYGNDDPR